MFRKGSYVYVFISALLIVTMVVLILVTSDKLAPTFVSFLGNEMSKNALYVLPIIALVVLIKVVIYLKVPGLVRGFVPITSENKEMQQGLSRFFTSAIATHSIVMLVVIEIFHIAAGQGNDNYRIMWIAVIGCFVLIISGLVFWIILSRKNR